MLLSEVVIELDEQMTASRTNITIEQILMFSIQNACEVCGKWFEWWKKYCIYVDFPQRVLPNLKLDRCDKNDILICYDKDI